MLPAKFLCPNICAAKNLTPYGKYIHQKSHFWIGKETPEPPVKPSFQSKNQKRLEPLNLLTFKALKLRTILRHVRFWLEPQFLGRIQIVLETFKSKTPETSLSLLLWREWLRFPYLCSWIDTGRTDTDRIDPARTAHAAPGPDRTGQTLLIW